MDGRRRAASTQVRPVGSLAELDAVYAIDDYPTRANISRDLFREWYRAYPPGFLGAFEEDAPVGVIGLFPVTAAWAESFKRHELTEHDLRASIIERGKQAATDWYLSGISLDRQRVARARTGGWRSAKLICRCFLQLYRLNHAVIRTRAIRIVSAAATQMGGRLLTHHGFGLVAPADAQRPLDAIFERTMDQGHFDDLFLRDPTCAAVCEPVLLDEYRSIAANPAG